MIEPAIQKSSCIERLWGVERIKYDLECLSIYRVAESFFTSFLRGCRSAQFLARLCQLLALKRQFLPLKQDRNDDSGKCQSRKQCVDAAK